MYEWKYNLSFSNLNSTEFTDHRSFNSVPIYFHSDPALLGLKDLNECWSQSSTTFSCNIVIIQPVEKENKDTKHSVLY